MRVLVLTEGPAKFTPDRPGSLTERGEGGVGFSLSKFLSLVGGMTHPDTGERVEFVRAHTGRRPAGSTDATTLWNARLSGPDAIDLRGFAELWLLGIVPRGQERAFDRNELAAILEFMNRGGGVFATGDHEDFGANFGAETPRVRCMRRWRFDPSTPSADLAPSAVGPRRHDTLLAGADRIIQQSDQSDQLFQWAIPAQPFARAHPILRSRLHPGALLLLWPDHMHEGHCDVRFDQADFPTELRPIAIRRSAVNAKPDGTVGDLNGPAVTAPQPESFIFDSMAAYDGHIANVGRVLTDSSFHHFVDVNLIGDEDHPDPQKRIGAEANLAAIEQLQETYRNMVEWLLPPSSPCAVALEVLIATGADDKRNDNFWHHGTSVDLSVGVSRIGSFPGEHPSYRDRRFPISGIGEALGAGQVLVKRFALDPPIPLHRLHEVRLHVDLGEAGKSGPASHRDNWDLSHVHVDAIDAAGARHSLDVPSGAVPRKFLEDGSVVLGRFERSGIAFGMTHRLRHLRTGASLRSETARYSHPGSSFQQRVVAGSDADSAEHWIVNAAHGRSIGSGVRLRNRDVLRLTHANTRRNLHSHALPSPVSAQQEITAFGDAGLGDDNDNWRIELLDDANVVQPFRPFRLIHLNTGVALHSHPIGFAGRQEVTGFRERDENDLWYFLDPIYIPIFNPFFSLATSVRPRT